MSSWPKSWAKDAPYKENLPWWARTAEDGEGMEATYAPVPRTLADVPSWSHPAT